MDSPLRGLGLEGPQKEIPRESVEELNHLVVRVIDATGNFQARGKQSKSPHGIWYTRVSGIWQSVWLETAPQRTWGRFLIIFVVHYLFLIILYPPGFGQSCLFG